MTIYVFTGPTLAVADAREHLDAVYLPPVQQGDVYRVALRQPCAIGIVDGYFEAVPAVRHKEILWAMDRGIHVFGSASMGALRAAELAQFGMVGVGKIFAAYRDGALEDDDEVAVVHGQRGAGYAAVSEAMANIRYTLAGAEETGVIGAITHAALLRIAKALFYKQRDPGYRQLLQTAARQGLPDRELRRLTDWLDNNRINQKRDDALAMLHAMRDARVVDRGPQRVSYRFERTTIWDVAMEPVVPVIDAGDNGPEWLLLDSLLDEVRLAGETCVDEQQEAQLRALVAMAEPPIDAYLADHLHNLGLVPFIRRAYDKECYLLTQGIPRPELDDIKLPRSELASWHFEQRLHLPKPDDIDRYATTLGFADPEAFFHALVGEYLYASGNFSSTLIV